ncbi:hypothetical protein [Oleiagrimonas sp.]|jgi:hypothetical protein|uniref:hypothetical protein n=1 Tax=Oleiagrimonas sp. TaxID=2010330 RepID=UPI00262E3442|nr:hypothetical protein [Oleiagrimonas sp.]MDA3914887.1 hypothetical protein [Oleiagrimonas sp.]
MSDSRHTPFRILVWVILLLSAWGILQYVTHASHVLHALGRPATAHAKLWWMLVWDAIYVLVAGVMLVATTGALMWRRWARGMLRGVCIGLALYSLASGVLLFAQWQSFSLASTDMMAQAVDPRIAHTLYLQARRITMVGLALKLVAVPLLGWVWWQLGTPSLRRRFAANASGT